jgi:glycolate oxidase
MQSIKETKRRSPDWKRGFGERLSQILGWDGVIYADDELLAYDSDALTGYRIRPLFVVLPRTSGEVSRVMKMCYDEDVPFVPRGAGTGLSGGALPTDEGIVISLARMNRIIEVDIPNERVVVEPGVTNLSVTNAVSSYGYYYAPDPSSQIVATIGGNVAENSEEDCLPLRSNHEPRPRTRCFPRREIIETGEDPDHRATTLWGSLWSEGLLGSVTGSPEDNKEARP